MSTSLHESRPTLTPTLTPTLKRIVTFYLTVIRAIQIFLCMYVCMYSHPDYIIFNSSSPLTTSLFHDGPISVSDQRSSSSYQPTISMQLQHVLRSRLQRRQERICGTGNYVTSGQITSESAYGSPNYPVAKYTNSGATPTSDCAR